MMGAVTSVLSNPTPRDERLAPSQADDSVRSLTVGLGGAIGRFARVDRSWWSPLRVALAVCTITFALGVLQKAPCMEAGWDRQNWRPFKAMCYSDIGYLYQERGFAEGNMLFRRERPRFVAYEQGPAVSTRRNSSGWE